MIPNRLEPLKQNKNKKTTKGAHSTQLAPEAYPETTRPYRDPDILQLFRDATSAR